MRLSLTASHVLQQKLVTARDKEAILQHCAAKYKHLYSSRGDTFIATNM